MVRHIAHDVLVMYLGLAMEQGPKDAIYANPLHPYTRALMAATPGVGPRTRDRIVLRGELPSPLNPPQGCVFSTRCPHATDRCRQERRPAARSPAGRWPATTPRIPGGGRGGARGGLTAGSRARGYAPAVPRPTIEGG